LGYCCRRIRTERSSHIKRLAVEIKTGVLLPEQLFLQAMGGTNKKKAGRLLDGRTWDDMPQE